MGIEAIRKQYPEYNDMSDEQLAGAIHQTHYPDLSWGDFTKGLARLTAKASDVVGEAVNRYTNHYMDDYKAANAMTDRAIRPIESSPQAGDSIDRLGNAVLGATTLASAPFNAARRTFIGDPIKDAVKTVAPQSVAELAGMAGEMLTPQPFSAMSALGKLGAASGAVKAAASAPMMAGLLKPRYRDKLVNRLGVELSEANKLGPDIYSQAEQRLMPEIKAIEYDARARAAGAVENTDATYWAGRNEVPGYPFAGKPGNTCARNEGCLVATQVAKDTMGNEYTPAIGREIERRMALEGQMGACPGCYDVGKMQQAKTQHGTEIAPVKPGAAGYTEPSGAHTGWIQENALPDGHSDVATRMQIRNDLEPAHLASLIASTNDIGKRGGALAYYSKDPRIGDILGDTGAYIDFSSSRSMKGYADPAEAARAAKLAKNGSHTAIEATEDGMWAAFKDPDTHGIIGGHFTKSTPEHVANLAGIPIDEFADATKQQNPLAYQTKIKKKTNPSYNPEVAGSKKYLPEEVTGVSKVESDSPKYIHENEHWGDQDIYMALANNRGVIPPFQEYLLEREYKPVSELFMSGAGSYFKKKGSLSPEELSKLSGLPTQEITAIKGVRKGQEGIDQFNSYLAANKDKWNPDYMKVIGPEYGRKGSMSRGYEATDPSKINYDAAEQLMQDFERNTVKKDHSNAVRTAESVVRDATGKELPKDLYLSIDKSLFPEWAKGKNIYDIKARGK